LRYTAAVATDTHTCCSIKLVVIVTLTATSAAADQTANRTSLAIAAETNSNIIASLALKTIRRTATNETKLATRRTTIAVLPISRNAR